MTGVALFLSAWAAATVGGLWSSPRARATVLHLGGCAVIYVAQRLFAGDPASTPMSLVGVVTVIEGLILRGLATRDGGDGSKAERSAMAWQALSAASLLVYALTLEGVTTALGLDEDARQRWVVSWTAVWPILWVVGALPAALLDLAMARHPVRMPEGARQHAVQSGLATALAFSLVFPVNYLANEHDVEWDFSYFRVTRPGSSTQALVNNLDKPTEVLLFYPANSEVKEKLVPYFDELAAGSTKLTVRVVDQPMEPKLSEELQIRDNGYVVIRQSKDDGKPATEKFKIDPDLKRARKDLRKLDETFQKYLLKLAKGKRVAYVMTGHGEAGTRDENPVFKLGEFKNLLRAQNYDVNDFGLDQGSSGAVPEDAALVVVPAPEKALLPEEVTALEKYVEKGGAVLIYLDPGRDRLTDLLGYIGIAAGEAPLAHASKMVPVTGGIADRINLFSNRFGSHAAVTTLSKFSSQASVVMLGAVSLTETGKATAPSPAKFTPLIRSNDDTWEDANGNMNHDPDEAGKVFVLAEAIQGPDTAPYRVIVVGDVSVAGDFVVQRSKGSAQLLIDATRWLIGEEDLVGETQSEEDVQIEHTKEGDAAWFYGTIFGVPALLLVAGAVLVRARARAA